MTPQLLYLELGPSVAVVCSVITVAETITNPTATPTVHRVLLIGILAINYPVLVQLLQDLVGGWQALRVIIVMVMVIRVVVIRIVMKAVQRRRHLPVTVAVVIIIIVVILVGDLLLAGRQMDYLEGHVGKWGAVLGRRHRWQ